MGNKGVSGFKSLMIGLLVTLLQVATILLLLSLTIHLAEMVRFEGYKN